MATHDFVVAGVVQLTFDGQRVRASTGGVVDAEAIAQARQDRCILSIHQSLDSEARIVRHDIAVGRLTPNGSDRDLLAVDEPTAILATHDFVVAGVVQLAIDCQCVRASTGGVVDAEAIAQVRQHRCILPVHQSLDSEARIVRHDIAVGRMTPNGSDRDLFAIDGPRADIAANHFVVRVGQQVTRDGQSMCACVSGRIDAEAIAQAGQHRDVLPVDQAFSADPRVVDRAVAIGRLSALGRHDNLLALDIPLAQIAAGNGVVAVSERARN